MCDTEGSVSLSSLCEMSPDVEQIILANVDQKLNSQISQGSVATDLIEATVT